ncbi:hypothetical protein M2263_004387 [Providencia alcalifaciens]|nr:hypothetical protein [Providencia alcalifaciens]
MIENKKPDSDKRKVGYRAPQYGDIKEKQWHKLRHEVNMKVHR